MKLKLKLNLVNKNTKYVDNINNKIKELKEKDLIKTKDISDTYHTFGELYDHRMAFNVALCQAITLLKRKDLYCYKSWFHHDKTMFDGMFIVVIESPYGQISYHYNAEHWDKFNIQPYDIALMYDGHTPDDTYDRLLKLFNKE